MEALLTFIFFIVVFYYAFRLFIRYAAPWLIARFMKKQQERYNNMSGFQQHNQSGKEEGEVTVKSSKSDKSKDDSGFGEYVDFEEVDK